MEEKDSNESFEYDYEEIDDEFQLSNPSTRRQTVTNPNELMDSYINPSNITQFLAYPQFNRANKRNLTHNLNPVPINWATSRPVSSEMSTLTIEDVRPLFLQVAFANSFSPLGADR